MKYQQMFLTFVFCGGVIMGLQISQTEAATIIYENSRTQTLTCDGKSYDILGNSNHLTLTGECDKVSVRGNWNVVSVDAVNLIQVTGNSNEVRWGRALRGDEPEVLNVGSKNKVIAGFSGAPQENKSSSQDSITGKTEQPQIQIKTSDKDSESKQIEISGSQIRVKRKEESGDDTDGGSDVNISGSNLYVKSSGKTVTIIQDNENKTIDCGQGGSVVVSGDGNTLKVTGQCSGLALTGSNNTITLDIVSKIKITGDQNQVFWKSSFGTSEVKIEDIGSGNSINHVEE